MVAQPRSETVTTSAQRLVRYAPTRTCVMLFNNSAAIIYIGTDALLDTGNGFPLQGFQGAVIAPEFGDDPTLAYWFIVGAGTVDLRVWEGFGKEIVAVLNELLQYMKGIR